MKHVLPFQRDLALLTPGRGGGGSGFWERTYKLPFGDPNTTIVVDLADVLLVLLLGWCLFT